MVENNDDFVSYHYFPEDKADFGSITINKNNGDIIKYSTAKTDEFKRYLFHLQNKIEEFIKSDKFEDEGFVMWY